MEHLKRIAILGGGPSALFMFKRLIESGYVQLEIVIFESKNKLGEGMPYSADGACNEHITNVSSNEIPQLVTSLSDWISTVPKDTLIKFNIDSLRFNEYKVLPRLLFGQYLSDQFNLLHKQARAKGLSFKVHYNSKVTDVMDHPLDESVTVEINGTDNHKFDHVVVCTGHQWPQTYEGKIIGYFDSPYPPAKLAGQLNHPIAIKGSSLTAVDAIKTLARHNGTFEKDDDGMLSFHIAGDNEGFKIVLHTRNGMLPGVRFHLDDPHLQNDALLSQEEIAAHIEQNDGFLSLDYIFEHNFKLPIKEKAPEFFKKIETMNLEQFVAAMIELREELDPFQLLRAEYAEAEKSIKRQHSVYWKEMLGVLSFALNYPAKYLSAEDRERLQTSLAPLISIVIAFIPQSSAQELLALHQAKVLSLVAVGDVSIIEPMEKGGATYHYTDDQDEEVSAYFKTYIDCVGQPHLAFENFPFKSLLEHRTVSPATLRFRSPVEGAQSLAAGEPVILTENGDYFLKVPGISVNDHFQVVDEYGAFNERIYVMAVPYMSGYNPDYSGLDFCETASGAIINRMLEAFSPSVDLDEPLRA